MRVAIGFSLKSVVGVDSKFAPMVALSLDNHNW